jgi:hypothetical protein
MDFTNVRPLVGPEATGRRVCINASALGEHGKIDLDHFDFMDYIKEVDEQAG